MSETIMTSQRKLNVICFGMGAIGTYIGGSLAAHGANVIFIEKKELLNGARKRGIRLIVGDKKILLPNIVVTADIAEALSIQPADVAILAVKSYDTADVLESLSGFEMTFPPVLCLQNGVENEDLIARRLGEDRVIAGTITSAVGHSDLGEVKLERLRGVGIEKNHDLSQTLINWFNLSGLNAKGYSSRANMKWSKMLTNLLANANSAILNWTPKQVFLDPITWRIELEQIREALAVMKALRIRLTDLPGTPVIPLMMLLKSLPAGMSQKLIGIPLAKGRGSKMPSFHIDLYSGKKKSEVSYLNGAVIRFGEKAGVPTPVNQRLCDLLEKMAIEEIAKQDFDNQPEKLDRWVCDET